MKKVIFKCTTCGFQTDDLWLAVKHAEQGLPTHKVVALAED